MAKQSAATLKIAIQMVDQYTKELRNFQGGITKMASNLKTVLGVGVGVYVAKQFIDAGRAVLGMVDQVTDAADKTAKMSKQIGLNVVTLQELQYAAGLSGVSVETLNTSLQQAERRLQSFAATGKGPAAEVFKRLGIDSQIAAGQIKDSGQLIQEMSRLVTGGRANLADVMDVFGRSGGPMMVLLKEGPDGIKKLQSELNDLGGVMDEVFFRNSEQYRDELDRLNTAWNGIKMNVVREILPDMNSLLREIIRFIKDNKAEIVGFFVELAGAMESVSRAVLDAIDGLIILKSAASGDIGKLLEMTSEIAGRKNTTAATPGKSSIVDDLIDEPQIDREKLARIKQQYLDFLRDLGIARLNGMEKELAEADRNYEQQTRKLEEFLDGQGITFEEYQTGLVELTKNNELERAKIVDDYRNKEQQEAQKFYAEQIRMQEEALRRQREAILTGTDALKGFRLGAADAWREMQELGQVGYQAAYRVADRIADINPLFDAIVLRTTTVKAAFKSMGIDILRTLAQVIARIFAVKIAMGLIGFFSGASGGDGNAAAYSGFNYQTGYRTVASTTPTASWGPSPVVAPMAASMVAGAQVTFVFPNNLDAEGTKRMLLSEKSTIENIFINALQSKPSLRREIGRAAQVY